MDPAQLERIEGLFGEALEQPADEREAFLEQATDDDDLREQVRELLAGEHAARSYFDGVRDRVAATADDALDGSHIAQRFGPYRTTRVLGRGGMGSVYEAERVDGQFEQRVALKLIRRGMETEGAISRFIAERQILAKLSHPAIARLLDGGVTDDGRPYFVMELVDGLPLHRYCAEQRLTLEQRLEVFVALAEAVDYAHRNLVVHRDLKPSNVMVAADRRRGTVVKLLDFGISKLTENADREAPELTRPGSIMGTPRHMAPEQVTAEEDVDARADIHAAGSMLYTALVGRSPFQANTATATLARVLEGRYDAPTTLVAGLPRELEAIIAKAMAVRREDRYQSCEEMRRALLPFATGKRSELREADGAGPPAVDESAPVTSLLDPDNLPRLASVGGTEVKTEAGAWPLADGGRGAAPPGTVLPVGDPKLELDVPTGWKPGDKVNQSPAPKPARSIPWGVIAVVMVLGVGGWAAWSYRSDIESTASGLGDRVGGSKGKPGEVVLLMVDTKPKDAIVFIDDVQHAERPIQLPKTGEYIKIRVEAEGYEPRVMQIEAKVSRKLDIVLDKAKGKK